MAVEFAVFLPHTKRIGYILYQSLSAIDNLKTMAGGYAVHKRQAILSTTVVISHTFCTKNEKELTPRGAWQ